MCDFAGSREFKARIKGGTFMYLLSKLGDRICQFVFDFFTSVNR